MEVLKVLWGLFVFVTATEATARCYQCLGVDNIESCNIVNECTSSDMKCHARKYYSNSAYHFDLDCAAKSVCDVLQPDDSAALFEVDMWSSCCDGSYCNKDFDANGDVIPPTPNRFHCYDCDGVADPYDCQHTTLCAVGEVCLTKERVLEGGAAVFDLLCYDKGECESIGHHLPFGKRLALCRGCCDERDNCNNQFCSRKLGLTNMTALGSSMLPLSTSTPIPATTSIYDQYTLTVTPKNQVGNLNGIASFVCKLEPKDASLGSLQLSWYFSGESGPIYSQAVTDPELTLTIHTLVANDSGTYTCEVNKTDHTWMDSGLLTVTSGATHLDILKGPNDRTVLAGDDVTFNCDVQGNPKPTITWQLIHDHDHITDIITGVTTTPTGSKLEISHVKDSDAGIYRCFANNQVQSKGHLAILKVESSPRITKGPISQRAKFGSFVRLDCQVSGSPTPTVQWTFVSPSGLKLIPAGTSINMDDSVDIPKMTADHIGTWTCLVSNSHGRVQASAILNTY